MDKCSPSASYRLQVADSFLASPDREGRYFEIKFCGLSFIVIGVIDVTYFFDPDGRARHRFRNCQGLLILFLQQCPLLPE